MVLTLNNINLIKNVVSCRNVYIFTKLFTSKQYSFKALTFSVLSFKSEMKNPVLVLNYFINPGFVTRFWVCSLLRRSSHVCLRGLILVLMKWARIKGSLPPFMASGVHSKPLLYPSTTPDHYLLQEWQQCLELSERAWHRAAAVRG